MLRGGRTVEPGREMCICIQQCSLLNRSYVKSIEKIIPDLSLAAKMWQQDIDDNHLLGYT